MPIWGRKWSLQIAQTLCRQNIPLRSPKHLSLQHSAYFSWLLVQEKQVPNLHTHYFFFCYSHTQREVAQHTGTNYIPYWAGHAKDMAHWQSRGFLIWGKLDPNALTMIKFLDKCYVKHQFRLHIFCLQRKKYDFILKIFNIQKLIYVQRVSWIATSVKLLYIELICNFKPSSITGMLE